MDEEKKFDEMIFEYSDVLVSFLEKKLSIKESNFFRGDFSPEVIFKNKNNITVVNNKLFNEIGFIRSLISEIKNKKSSLEEESKK